MIKSLLFILVSFLLPFTIICHASGFVKKDSFKKNYLEDFKATCQMDDNLNIYDFRPFRF
ncbi:hypothetical protein VSA01S_35970 [Vibrio sagamiensis NBRC 104589]|uniref:Uncharacterized protein n=1 Tax=Vibrio sagamiensis NBRC 104589 TaxID=1219064 RepID=A0A511QJI1_9VIBR|nr:hypothetical protein VSA01S_35970 [Vibrio sagamiensis NBRC 104589]